MHAASKNMQGYLGFSSAVDLKEHVVKKNGKIVGAGLPALVIDPHSDVANAYYLMVRRHGRDDLYMILPVSKGLCVATVRQERKDIPYIFEVLA